MKTSMDDESCRGAVPWASLVSMIIAISGCVFFTLSFADGIEGFLFQLNTIATMSDSPLNTGIRSNMFKVAAVFCFSIIIFLVISIFATSALSFPSRGIEARSRIYRIFASHRAVALTITFAHTILVLWLFILCITSMALIVYLIFYASMQQFCALLDSQCFDFRILIPVVQKLTNDKVNLLFCKEKKEAICNTSHVSNFFIAFISCILATLGVVYFLMSMASNYTRLRARVSTRKGQHYAMNTGTVDSDSIIMHSMGKQ